MIVYCTFLHGNESIEEPIEFPCRLNVGDTINPVFITDLPVGFPEGDWEVMKSGFFRNASETSQRVYLLK